MTSIIIPKNHISFTSCKDIKEICEPMFHYFNITYFAHTIYYFKTNQITNLITDGDVAKEWIIKQFSMPASNQTTKVLKTGFYLAEFMGNLYPEQYRNNMREKFNIDYILLFIESYDDHYEFFTFGTMPENYQIINQYFNNIDILINFISYYKDKAKKLINKANNSLVELIPRANIRAREQDHDIKYEIPPVLKNFIRINELKIDNQKICITKRESDCLFHLSTGKSIKACANIMNLSSRTVESYLDTLKSKCGVNNKQDLINIFWQNFTIIRKF